MGVDAIGIFEEAVQEVRRDLAKTDIADEYLLVYGTLTEHDLKSVFTV